MSSGRRRQRGQALVELAISVPVLLWLLLGSFDATVMVSDKVIAGYATRQGARLAAEIGGSETNNPPAKGCAHTVFRGSRMNFARIHNSSFVNATETSPPSTPSNAYSRNSHGLTS